jgi:alpha-tubulin suppressor-like RCC1 family protein
MKTSRTLPAVALLSLALSLALELSLHGTVTNVAWYRLGENDPGAVPGLVATNSIDVVANRVLTLVGGPFYDTNVASSAAAHVGSSLGVRFSSTTWGTNALVSTVVDNFGLEAWVNPSALAGDHMIVYNGHSGTSGWGLNLANGFYSVLFGGVQVIGSVPAGNNVWTHLALVRDGGVTTFYANGIASATSTATPNVPGGLFGVANAPNPPGAAVFQGLLDEVRVFTFAPGQFNTNDLLLSFGPIPVVITTGPTMQITNTATLNGTVNPRGLATTAWFEWGTAVNNYTRQTAPVAIGTDAVALAVSNTLSGLTPGIIYHCRAVGSNAAGVVRGKDVPFGSPAIVLNGAAVLTNECHFAFIDPGATAFDTLLAIAGGAAHSLALRSDGTVVAWGYNFFGQTNIPVGLSNVVAIAGGEYHSLGLRNDGTLAAWGDNASGQTNIPVGLSNVVAIAAGSAHNLALRSDGTVVAWGRNIERQTNIPVGLSNVVAIAAGSAHNLALRSDGSVIAWGYNFYGQTNIPVGLSNVVAIAGGGFHSLALRSDGSVAAWGYNTSGQTTIPTGLSNVVAIVAGSSHSLALRSEGSLTAWGRNNYGQTNIPVGLSNVVAIAAGHSHNLAVRTDGSLAVWGWNDYGQTDIPAALNTLAVTVSGSVNTNSPGSSLLTYTSTNALGGVGRATRTVIVSDTLGPVITLFGNNPILVTNVSNLPLVDPGAFAVDLCGGAAYSVTASNAVNVNFPGAYAITYRSSDVRGNIGVTTRTVIVALPPVPGDQNGDRLVSQSELDAVYARYVTTSPWLAMTNVAGLGQTNVTFALSNSLAGAYSIEVSTNLASWQFLGPATPRYEFTDTNALALPQRYYRLRYP